MKFGKKRLTAMLMASVLLVSQGNISLAEEDKTNQADTQGEQKENSWRYENGVLKDVENQDMEGKVSLFSDRKDYTLHGIDVSEHNSVSAPGKPGYKPIDWEKAQASGMVDFAIIRCGYGNGTDEDGNYIQDDQDWKYNVSECERLGIPYGVYIYSYATDTEMALNEAEHVLRLIKGKKLSYPVYFDMEDNSTLGSDLTAIAKTFCNAITEAGYPVGIYSNLNWLTNYLTDPVFKDWYLWYAQWNVDEPTYAGEFGLWQYSSKGQIPGIVGNVDMNYQIGYPEEHGDLSTAFEDVIIGDWYRSAVRFMANRKIMTGLTETKFGPAESLYRSQFATTLYRIEKMPKVQYEDKFPDVPEGQFYTDSVMWASSNDIIKGYDSNGYFGTTDYITREQMIVMMYRYAQYIKMDTTPKENMEAFSDSVAVSDFAKEAMQWAVAEELIKGDAEGKLNPQGNANRAECASILMRFVQMVEQEKTEEKTEE